MKRSIFYQIIFFSTFTIYQTALCASVPFNWTPNTESNLGGYIIYYGTESRNYQFSHDAGNPPLIDGKVTTMITGLEDDTLYYFSLIAYLKTGSPSGQSWELTCITPSSDSSNKFKIWTVYLNDDAIQDTVFINETGVYAIYGSKTTTAQPTLITSDFTLGVWSPEKNILKFTDINGDGILDFYGIGDYGIRVAYGIDGYSFEPSYVVMQDFAYAYGWQIDKHPRKFTDINGDGILDFYGIGDYGIRVAYGIDGYSFEPSYVVMQDFAYAYGWQIDKHPRKFTDINGDGILDFYGIGDYGIRVAYGIDGYSFEQSALLIHGFGYSDNWSINDFRNFTDINQDGFIDFVGWKDNDLWTSISMEGMSFGDVSIWE